MKKSVLKSKISAVDLFDVISVESVLFVFRALTDFDLELVLFSLVVGRRDVVIIFSTITSDRLVFGGI